MMILDTQSSQFSIDFDKHAIGEIWVCVQTAQQHSTQKSQFCPQNWKMYSIFVNEFVNVLAETFMNSKMEYIFEFLG